MIKKILVGLILIISLSLFSGFVIADFQPYGNIDLSNIWGIFNATSINSTEFYQDGNQVLDTSGGYFNSESNLTGLLDDNYRNDSWDNFTGIPTATPSNGDTTHLSTANQIYDYIVSLAYTTLSHLQTNYYNKTETYTKTESDSNFVDISGDTMTGDLNLTGDLEVGGNITLTDKITFALGETIDNLVNGVISIVGNLVIDGTISFTAPVECTGGSYMTYFNGTDSICVTPSEFLLLTGGNMTGDINMGGNEINNVTNISSDYYYVGSNRLNSSQIPDHNGHTVKDSFEHIINRGKAEAITITETGGLGINWTSGELYDKNTHTFFSTIAGSGSLTNTDVNYLKWVSGTGLTISTTASSGDEILIATFSVYDGNINSYRDTALMSETIGNTRRALRDLFPTRITSGMSVSEDSDVTNDLDVTMDAGVVWKDASDKMTPVEIKSRNTAMVRHFHTSGVWDSDTNAEINTTYYDNGTDLVAIPGNKYVKGLFIYMAGKIGFVYPTEYFNTISQAQDAALPAMPTGLEPIPKLTSIVYKQGVINFDDAIWLDEREGITTGSGGIVTDHGYLSGLSDDDHTQYLLADGTRSADSINSTGNIYVAEDYKACFNSACTSYTYFNGTHTIRT